MVGKLLVASCRNHCCLVWVQHFHSLQACRGGRDLRARSPLYRATIISLSSRCTQLPPEALMVVSEDTGEKQ